MASEFLKTTDKIYYFTGEQETDRPFLYYIKGRDYSVAIDAGQSKEHVEQFYAALQKEGLPLPDYTVLTHWHWDHTFGLPYIHGKSVASELTKQQLETVATWEWNEAAMEQRVKDGVEVEFVNDCIPKVYPDLSTIKISTPDITVKDTMTLDLGDIQVELYARDSIHSRDALLIYIPQEKALFVGDADCEDIYNQHEIRLSRLTDYRTFINGHNFERYFLGHDSPDTKENVMKYLDELEQKAIGLESEERNRLYQSLQTVVSIEKADDILKELPPAVNSSPEERAAWVEKLSAVLEASFDENTIKQIRQGCFCNENGKLEQTADALRNLYLSVNQDLDTFVAAINTNGAGWYFEDGSLYTKYFSCPCPMLEKATKSPSLTWCYCTAGYNKRLFELVFHQSVEVDVVHTIRQGYPECLLRVTF